MKELTFNLLIERLNWPDMLVREQTIIALQKFLLLNTSFKKNFLDIIEAQKLESKVVELLAIVFLVNKKQNNFFDFKEIDDRVQKSTLLSELYLREIFQINLNIKDRAWTKNYSNIDIIGYTATNNIKINSIVEKELEYLSSIAKKDIPVRERYDLEYDKIINSDKYEHSTNINYFCDTHYTTYANVKLYQHDMQISAYLKTIAYLVDCYNLPIEIAIKSVKRFMPLDLGLLLLKPSTKPEFLNDFLNLESVNWQSKTRDFIPVYLSCPLKKSVYGYDNKELVGIDMFPIFLDHNPKTLETHFNFFRYDVPNKMLHIEQTLDIRKIIIPNDIPKHFIGLFYRSYNCIQRLYSVCREFFIPNEQNLKIEIVDDKLYFKKQEKTIGYMQYWFDNYQTYTYSEAIPCSGVATYFNLDYIKDLRKQGQISLIINKKNYKSVNMKPFEVTENQYKLLKMDQIV